MSKKVVCPVGCGVVKSTPRRPGFPNKNVKRRLFSPGKEEELSPEIDEEIHEEDVKSTPRRPGFPEKNVKRRLFSPGKEEELSPEIDEEIHEEDIKWDPMFFEGLGRRGQKRTRQDMLMDYQIQYFKGEVDKQGLEKELLEVKLRLLKTAEAKLDEMAASDLLRLISE